MGSIVTVTINPTIDKTTSVSAMVPEKKLKCSPPLFEPGGGGINVARAIKKLGGDAKAVYLAGGYNGDLLKKLLTQEGINSLPVEIQKDSRENMIVLDMATNQQYRFGMPGPEITEKEWQHCLQTIEQIKHIDFLIASGSLSPGVPVNIFAQIADIARKKNAKLVVDTSGEALKLAVKEGVYLLKPNLGELASLAGKEELAPESVVETAKQIIGEGYCEVIIVSMGVAGAILITENIVQQLTAPPVKRKSTVGAGDSMVAGIVLSLSRGINLLESVKYGVACGTASTMNPGTELCRIEDVEKLYKVIML
ncbi:MAG: 1-phosphofructokinase family hexose kinase [Bacteroidota bacterium]|nr:1-phosphofructokinase family hexose kinase [Bacteroidota bacterium]